MVRRFDVVFLSLAFGCSVICAPQAFGKKTIPFSLRVSWTSSYDDNVLKYSARDLGRFETNAEYYPSEITTSDDWINTFSVRAYGDFRLGSKIRMRPYYSFRISRYSVNQITNYQSHYWLARISYRYRVYLYLQYFYMPDYYLRVYKDSDLNEYHGCTFDLYQPLVRLRLRFSPFEIEGRFGREYTYYNRFFTEYDSEASFFGIEGSYKVAWGLDLSLGYEFKASDNIGFSPAATPSAANPNEDTEYGDSSYDEDRVIFGATYFLPLESPLNWRMGLDFERRLRYYQSDLSQNQDPFHVGREDRRDIIEPGIAFSPSSTLEVEFKFSYDLRRSKSPSPSVSDVKNYDRRSFELTVNYQVF